MDQGHPKSKVMVPIIKAHWWFPSDLQGSIVFNIVSLTVFEIFDEKIL